MEKKETKALHPAVIAFMIILSLVALGFTAFAIGMTFFFVIEKYIADPINNYNYWSYESLKFAIASLIITTPIYVVLVNYIQKYLSNGALNIHSNVRKWLSYLTILVSSLIIIGELISVIISFLDGELTLRFGLKFLVVTLIAVGILLYNIFDIRREEIKGKNILRMVFNSIMIPLAIITLVVAFFMTENPSQVRYRKTDENTLSKLNEIKNAISTYNYEYGQLPESLDILKKADRVYIYVENYNSIDDAHPIKYTMIDGDSYSLCADFNLSSETVENYNGYNSYYYSDFIHEAGYQCFDIDVYSELDQKYQE